jgi:hypothetical protein
MATSCSFSWLYFNTKIHIYKRIWVCEDYTGIPDRNNIKSDLNTIKFDYLNGMKLQSTLKSITIKSANIF